VIAGILDEPVAARPSVADDSERLALADRDRLPDEVAERSARRDASSAAPKAAMRPVARRLGGAAARGAAAKAGADADRKGSGPAGVPKMELVWLAAEWGAAVPMAPGEVPEARRAAPDVQATKLSAVLPEDE
jgi:hypothetical protein